MSKLSSTENVPQIADSMRQRLKTVRRLVKILNKDFDYIETEVRDLRREVNSLAMSEEDIAPRLFAMIDVLKWAWERANWELSPALRLSGDFIEELIERIREIEQIDDKLFMEITGASSTIDRINTW